ncbi:hypothetical protein I4U23_030237 [Adineta vaga]|nr:hypothetical protein I4U23_030237 [Adineta vaga]
METDLPSNVHGNFQNLRNMWSIKAQEQNKLLGSSTKPCRSWCNQQKGKIVSSKLNVPILKITNEITREESTETILSSSEQNILLLEDDPLLSIPAPPPSIMFKYQAQNISVMKQMVNKMTIDEKKNILSKISKTTGIHRWKITRLAFRSGLIFNRSRRASDSILPLLMKTHFITHRSRVDSLNSVSSETPFESLIDYLTGDNDEEETYLTKAKKNKRAKSDVSDCLRRNRLDDAILQYKMVLQHLKNHGQFMAEYPAPSLDKVVQREKSFDMKLTTSTSAQKEEIAVKSSSPSKRQTRSLSRDFGRTFSSFIMNDLFHSETDKPNLEKQKRPSFSHASSQTTHSDSIHEKQDEPIDSNEEIQNLEFIGINTDSNEEADEVLNELDTMLEQQLPAPTADIVYPTILEVPIDPPRTNAEESLMQTLFEGKKTAYSPDDHEMKSIRLPNEMLPVYEIAKKKCFFDTERVLYTSMMEKIRRRSYSRHVRILCITTQRLYNLTKKDSYPKEVLLFRQILGVTCTPYKDGFVCIHSKESHDDRGDWLIMTEHPCEFITRLFMAMGRKNNNDGFLKIETKFSHCRRFSGESSSSNCVVEAYLAPQFSIKKTAFDTLIIYTP